MSCEGMKVRVGVCDLGRVYVSVQMCVCIRMKVCVQMCESGCECANVHRCT